MSERASADVCVVPRALRQRLGEGAGVRRRLYSLQLPRAEVCEVVVVVVRRRMRGGGRSGDKEGDKAEAGGARYDSWRVMCWDASVKGVALVTKWTYNRCSSRLRAPSSSWQ